MTTWTPVAQESETWTSQTTMGRTLFSRFVFSHASHNGKFVFAFRNAGFEGWHNSTAEAEIWTAA